MIGRLNHIGVATPSIADSQRLYREVFGATRISDRRALPEQGVSVSFVTLPNTEIELIEPYGDASPLHAFLVRNPRGGQHHICFEVENLLAASVGLVAAGARVLGSGTPRIGAHGAPILFLDPRDLGGVLVELMQPAAHA